MNSHAVRRRKLRALARAYDNILVMKPQNLFYLTNFWGAGVGVLLDDRTVLITSSMEKERAEKSSLGAEVVGAGTTSKVWEEVRKHLVAGSSVIDTNGELRDGKATVDESLFLKARRTKGRDEVEKIAAAGRKIDRIYGLIEREAKEGMTEREIAAEALRSATLEHLTPYGSEGSLSPIIVAGGENAAYPHAEITDRALRAGEFLVVDLFFRFEGYGADETRTFGVGQVSREMRESYQAVLAAQQLGVELSRSGSGCGGLHAQVAGVLGRRSLARYFTHGTGHGVGIDVHEMPSVGRTSDDKLKEGDIVTIEPGIYLPGRYGVRIEDTVQVGKHQTVLTRYTRELVVLG